MTKVEFVQGEPVVVTADGVDTTVLPGSSRWTGYQLNSGDLGEYVQPWPSRGEDVHLVGVPVGNHARRLYAYVHRSQFRREVG